MPGDKASTRTEKPAEKTPPGGRRAREPFSGRRRHVKQLPGGAAPSKKVNTTRGRPPPGATALPAANTQLFEPAWGMLGAGRRLPAAWLAAFRPAPAPPLPPRLAARRTSDRSCGPPWSVRLKRVRGWLLLARATLRGLREWLLVCESRRAAGWPGRAPRWSPCCPLGPRTRCLPRTRRP